MADATYVLFVPKAKRSHVRTALSVRAAEPIRWRERKKFFGSEFYLTGPAAAVRETHQHCSELLAHVRQIEERPAPGAPKDRFAPRSGPGLEGPPAGEA